jgi:hypothetical protein
MRDERLNRNVAVAKVARFLCGLKKTKTTRTTRDFQSLVLHQTGFGRGPKNCVQERRSLSGWIWSFGDMERYSLLLLLLLLRFFCYITFIRYYCYCWTFTINELATVPRNGFNSLSHHLSTFFCIHSVVRSFALLLIILTTTE